MGQGGGGGGGWHRAVGGHVFCTLPNPSATVECEDGCVCVGGVRAAVGGEPSSAAEIGGKNGCGGGRGGAVILC